MRRLLNPEQRALFLLIAVLFFFLLTPILENSPAGAFVLILSLYLILAAAVLELSSKAMQAWSGIPLAIVTMVLILASHVFPVHSLRVATELCLSIFLGLICAKLFTFLGRPGAISSAKIYISVSLYFLLALCWFVIFTVINRLQPGSFVDGGAAFVGGALASKLLYFSLATLTTLGYGDIVAVRPLARMLTTMEAANGVLYIAISVARLVAAYQVTRISEEQETQRHA
ncbi:MAG TPA: ion channel [Candidatus Eisenbacteria bacterium]|nr:ion channel [Candidatus Eisenbacteria bacterium]